MSGSATTDVPKNDSSSGRFVSFAADSVDASSQQQDEALASSTSTISTSNNRVTLRRVPKIEVELNHVTYAPLTSSIVDSSSNITRRNSHKNTKRKVILNDVSTTISPYRLSAWLGPSGSGKTSLITVAAGLYEKGDLKEGSEILVNGEAGSIPKRLVGVVWQDDLLLGNLTVKETIYFSAKLKTPQSTPDEQVQNLVEETLEELGLLHIRNSLIGSTTNGRRGISGGERKRVSVASELVVNPSVLFLDEPTVRHFVLPMALSAVLQTR